MRQFAKKISGSLVAGLLVLGAAAHPANLAAQDKAPASIHGHVNNAAGQPVTKGDVKLTTDRNSDAKARKYQYTFPIDANGDYKGTGVAPGNYIAFVIADDKSLDFLDNQDLKAGDDKTINFDMSRPEYIEKMTPEERKNLEEFKKRNADIVAGNAKIANLNTTLVQARADTKAGNYDAAITSMQQATQQKPDEAILWIALGDAQLGKADAAAKAAKSAGKANDPSVQSAYSDAAASYKKAVDANATAKKPNPETAAAAYNQLGGAYGKQGDVKDSSDAYEQAAKTQPAQAGMYYFNEAATFYNAGKGDDAAAAADKAIAADPKRAMAYYIKGQALIPKATVDPKTQKIVAPPGCVEAYQQYLELDPNGAHAEEVKQVLTGIGAQVKSTYKAGRK